MEPTVRPVNSSAAGWFYATIRIVDTYAYTYAMLCDYAIKELSVGLRFYATNRKYLPLEAVVYQNTKMKVRKNLQRHVDIRIYDVVLI
jgi:hypothetical protein